MSACCHISVLRRKAMAKANHPTTDAELRDAIYTWLSTKGHVKTAEENVKVAEARKAEAERGKPWVVDTLEELVAKRNALQRAEQAVGAACSTLAKVKETRRQRENVIKSVLGSDAWYAYRDDLYIGVQRTNWGLGDAKVLVCNPKTGQLPRLYIHCT